MKIQLLIAIVDGEYREHLSRVLRDKYSDAFEISICSNLELVRGLLGKKHYDVAILDPEMAEDATLRSAVQMPVLLWDGSTVLGRQSAGLKRIRKYQKISGIVSEMLELYAEVAGMGAGYGNRGSITVAWSPVGGCGKTTVALAYAAQRVAEGRKVVYLDMQNFSGSSAYFPQTGKSISSVFGKMDSNVAMLFQSIRLQDGDTGIYYFCQPENYDDINVLTADDAELLIESCAEGVDEVVVDLSSVCDEKTKRLLQKAERVLLVLDQTRTGKAKWEQFQNQNSIYKDTYSKMTLIANRGMRTEGLQAARVVSLPAIQSEDPVVVYKTLSSNYIRL